MKLSIQNTWYILVSSIGLAIIILILTWRLPVIYNIFLENAIEKETILHEQIHDHINNKISNLLSVLMNKSDPMSYTLRKGYDWQLINELFLKILERENSIHAMLLIARDGSIILGRENNSNNINLDKTGEHWDKTKDHSQKIFNSALNGASFIESAANHNEGVFFRVAVPVKSAGITQAVLIAIVDTEILWKEIHEKLYRKNTVTYFINKKGALLIKPKHSNLSDGEIKAANIPIARALINGKKWDSKTIYTGIYNKKVFGLSTEIQNLDLYVITEIEQEFIISPIRDIIIKLLGGMIFVIIFFTLSGMLIVRQISRPIELISKDFRRIAKQDYTPLQMESRFKELKSMISGYNSMIEKISHSQKEQQLSSIVFDNTSEGILITDSDNKIIRVNKSICDISGYSEDELLGKNPSIFKSGHYDLSFYKEMWKSILETGKWRGEILNKGKNGENYYQILAINTHRDERNKIIEHVGIITDISGIKQTEKELEEIALHDSLTHLPNRLLCNARIEHEIQKSIRNGNLVAVMFLDLDMFKNINDSFGHSMGDELLKEVASRIGYNVREEDTFARLGGDEFVIVIGSLKNRDGASIFAKNILEIFSKPFQINEFEIFSGVSIGISIYPDDGDNFDELLRNADSAMYSAKAKGRNNFQFYEVSLTEKVSERLNMETLLRRAIENNELSIKYQPQYSIKNNKIIGLEALLRWNNPELGEVMPDKFIPIAEETGLIMEIGRWTLLNSCRQLKTFLNSGNSSLQMAINLSSRQFWEPGLEKTVKKIIEETGINPKNLEFEITESVLMQDTDQIYEILNNFHEMGITISIDDFGTGYSSLSYITRFPISRLKIDRSFLLNIHSDKKAAEMIISIIALAHSMKLKVIAEGVETVEQLSYLEGHGCDEIQGFYFSKPISPEEMEKLLQDQNNLA